VLRVSLGVVNHGEVDTMLIKTECIDGVWQPPPDFFTCDALPDEWLELLQRFQDPRPAQGPPQLPSARQYMAAQAEGQAPKMRFTEEPADEEADVGLGSSRPLSERYWAIKFTVDSIYEAHPTPNDSWQVGFSMLGCQFTTFEVQVAASALPLAFHSIHRLVLRGPEAALKAWLDGDDPPVVDFEISSDLEPEVSRSVTVELTQLFRMRLVKGTFDVLTSDGRGGKFGCFNGEQLAAVIELEDLSSEATQIGGIDRARLDSLEVDEHAEAPEGLQVLSWDVHPTPALDTAFLSGKSSLDRSEGPSQHGIPGTAYKNPQSERNLALIDGSQYH